MDTVGGHTALWKMSKNCVMYRVGKGLYQSHKSLLHYFIKSTSSRCLSRDSKKICSLLCRFNNQASLYARLTPADRNRDSNQGQDDFQCEFAELKCFCVAIQAVASLCHSQPFFNCHLRLPMATIQQQQRTICNKGTTWFTSFPTLSMTCYPISIIPFIKKQRQRVAYTYCNE